MRKVYWVASRAWPLVGVALLAWTSPAFGQLYGHWPLNDGAGEEAVNLVEGAEPGYIFDWDADTSLGGTPDEPSVWVDDPVRGTVIGLNGESQWVDAGFIPVMTLENDFTWAFWGRLPPEQASPNNDIVLGNRWGETGSDTSPREFIKFTPNRFEYHMNGGFGDDLAYADSNQPLDTWVHNSIVKDGSSLTYYRNGELRNSTTISGGQTTDEPLTLGFGGDVGSSGGEAWRGFLSDVQLYTSALSPEQINSTLGGDLAAGADLYAHYPLTDGNNSDIAMGTGPGAVEALIDNPDAGLGDAGSVWFDDPDRGTVLSFAGTFVDAGELPLMDLENEFTWNFWSKSDGGQAQTSNTIIMGNRNDFDGIDNGEWIKFTNDRIEFHADGTNASDLEWGAAGPDDNRIPNDDQWYHHTVVKEGDEMRYYRNGELRNEVSLGLAQQTTEPLPFAMGGQAAFDSPGGETSIVYLSDVRLYEAALSPNEVAELAGVEVSTCDDSTMGDLDGNGQVEFADFLILSGNFGNEVSSHEEGDIDCNGTVEFADFLVLSGNFGNAVGVESVPEPTSFALVGLGALGLGCIRRRRR